MEADEAQALQGMGGYSKVARAINIKFSQRTKPYDRRQVESWYRRGTKNAAGQPFPDPVVDIPDAKSRTEHLLFDIASVLAWCEPGVPAGQGRNFMTMDQREARAARKANNRS